MARYEQHRWEANWAGHEGRRSRAAVTYEAYVPDEIAAWEPSLPGAVAAHVSEAERAIAALNADPPALASLETLARRLLRAESVASSRIEGLMLSQRRLAKAEAGGEDARDETARSILGNISAMEQAVEVGARTAPLTLADILSLHATLMKATNTPEFAGRLRTEQNWIGGHAFNPAGADFVPPPPNYVEGLVEDLCAFANSETLSPLAQAAIVHAQFETIHPFADGNGRVGRALIHVVLRRRGLAPRYVPPISLILASHAKSYVRGLTAFRAGAVADWCEIFADAALQAAGKAGDLAEALRRLQDTWIAQVGRPRADSSAAAIITLLPAHPILTVSVALEILGRSKQAVNDAVRSLEEAGVLRQITIGKRNRAWEASALFDLLNNFETELATPDDGNEVARPAPHRSR